jgi:hypothetical protein
MNKPYLLVLDRTALTKQSLASLVSAFQGKPLVTVDLSSSMEHRILVLPRTRKPADYCVSITTERFPVSWPELARSKRKEVPSVVLEPVDQAKLIALPGRDVPLKSVQPPQYVKHPVCWSDYHVVPYADELPPPRNDETVPAVSERAEGNVTGSHPLHSPSGNRIESSAPAGFQVGRLYQGSTPARSIADCWSTESPKDEIRTKDGLHNSAYGMVDPKKHRFSNYATQEKRSEPVRQAKQKTKGPSHWT